MEFGFPFTFFSNVPLRRCAFRERRKGVVTEVERLVAAAAIASDRPFHEEKKPLPRSWHEDPLHLFCHCGSLLATKHTIHAFSPSSQINLSFLPALAAPRTLQPTSSCSATIPRSTRIAYASLDSDFGFFSFSHAPISPTIPTLGPSCLTHALLTDPAPEHSLLRETARVRSLVRAIAAASLIGGGEGGRLRRPLTSGF